VAGEKGHFCGLECYHFGSPLNFIQSGNFANRVVLSNPCDLKILMTFGKKIVIFLKKTDRNLAL